MKKILMAIFFSLTSFAPKLQAKILPQTVKTPWVYFDLGDTVISTKDFSHLHYFKGAREYIEELKRQGLKIGIITNIPESWGQDYNQKLLALKKVIQDGWEEQTPFDWSVFDEVILPLNDSEMKPAPGMFMRALEKAGDCPSVYIGESIKEIATAKSLGMAAKLFKENDSELYIPLAQMEDYLKNNYQRSYDRECFYK